MPPSHLTLANSPSTLTGVGHHGTVSTNTGCNQWFALASYSMDKLWPCLFCWAYDQGSGDF
jgi:hypothetical protein